LVEQSDEPTPNGEDVEDYARQLQRSVNRAYPTPFLLHRFSNTLNDDLRQTIIKGGNHNEVARGRNDRPDALEALGNRYRYLGVPEILTSEALSGEERLTQVENAIAHLAAFYQNNPQAELRTARFFGTEERRTPFVWEGIPEPARGAVQKQLMAYQRVLSLTPSFETANTLLGLGINSANDVVNTDSNVITGYPEVTPNDWQEAVSNAHNVLEQVSHTYANAVDLHWGNYYNIHVDNIPRNLINQLADVPGYDQLFGPQNYCDCTDCRSVLSPAAYFVDLMNYIKDGIEFYRPSAENINNDDVPDFPLAFDEQIPISLKNRRPDLWQLKLTCDNTYKLVPYLDIVNEIKEAYLRKVFWTAMQNDDNADNDDISEDSIDIYALLADVSEKHSFQTPFNLPFAELGILLQHFGIELNEIQEATFAAARKADADEELGTLNVSRKEQISRYKYQQYLGISREEWHVIIHADVSEEHQRMRYGFSGDLTQMPMSAFQKATGLSRPAMDELLRMKTLDRTGLGAITVLKELPDGEVQNFVEFLEGLTSSHLDFIHRLLRLQRSLPWTFRELDLALMSTLPDDDATIEIDVDTLNQIVRLLRIQQELEIPFEQAIALLYGLPETSIRYRKTIDALTGEPRQELLPDLYSRAFDLENIFGFASSIFFYHRLFNEENPEDQEVDPKMPYLLRGLGITESDWDTLLELLKGQLNLHAPNGPLNGKFTLRKETLDLFYRHVFLARQLGWSIREFSYLVRLILDGPITESLEQVERLIEVAARIEQLDLPPSTLWFYLQGEETETQKFQTNWEAVGAFVLKIRKNLAETADTLNDAFETCIGERLGRTAGLINSYVSNFLFYLESDTDFDAYSNAIEVFEEDGSLPASAYDVYETVDVNHPDVITALPLFNLLREIESKYALMQWLDLEDRLLMRLRFMGQSKFGIEDLKNLNWLDLVRLRNFQEWVQQKEEVTEVDIMKIINQLPSDLTEESILLLSELLQVDRNLIISTLKVTFQDYFGELPIDRLMYIKKVIQLCGKLGLDAHSLAAFYDSNYADSKTASKLLRAAFRSKYKAEEKWEDAYEPFQDRINEVKRDALCHFIIAHEEALGFKDVNDLYDYFLIDIEMSGCGRTSRLLAATLSLQLLVHRVLLQLEQYTDQYELPVFARFKSSSRDYQKEWEWRKNYRVWEANRKVFLYPENYLEPEWRDNKTPIFKELEDELLQEKITLAAAEQAYKQYLKKYIDLSNLKIAGACYDSENRAYHIFGRTAKDPYQYFYRKYRIEFDEWTAWEKVKLSISSPHVGPVVFRNRLYIFWVNINTQEKGKFENGNSSFSHFSHQLTLNYSYLEENGEWLQPQKIEMPILRNKYQYYDDHIWDTIDNPTEMTNSFKKDFYEHTKTYEKLYPSVEGNRISIYYSRERIWEHGSELVWASDATRLAYFLDEFSNKLEPKDTSYGFQRSKYGLLSFSHNSIDEATQLVIYNSEEQANINDEELDIQADWAVYNYKYDKKQEDLNGQGWDEEMIQFYDHLTNQREIVFTDWYEHDLPNAFADESIQLFSFSKKPVLNYIHSSKLPYPIDPEQLSLEEIEDRKIADFIFEYDNQTYIFHRALDGNGLSFSRKMTRLSTSVNNDLIQKINDGLEPFLSTQTQTISEKTLPLTFQSGMVTKSHEATNHLNFDGPLGNYFWELFFHIPYTIADHLNAEGKYKEANWWYQRIFNPSAQYEADLENQSERFWRFIKFRLSNIDVSQFVNLDPEEALPPLDYLQISLEKMLTFSRAIRAYEKDPFNPHAIARLRLGAYPKAIVMKYIDNLLDWGDFHFTKDTWEDNNEALMLYMLAKDILGPRPKKLGKCDIIDEDQITYAAIEEGGTIASDFLIYLENWVPWQPEPEQPTGEGGNNGLGYRLGSPENQRQGGSPTGDNYRFGESYFNNPHNTIYMVVDGDKPAFCVPPNKDLKAYWDRVEDRLFKLRNCMNIEGVRRSLALFQPPIDPALLVAASAAGLSLSDILSGLDAAIPPYRFSYLIEKAKGFTGTVQSLGGALLSALEKKDTEALTLLRSTHERNILKLTRDVKKQAVEEARVNILAAQEGMKNTMNRILQYALWIEEDLNGWERTQQISLHTVSIIQGIEAIYGILASTTSLIPNVGAPTAITYGGREVSSSMRDYAHVMSSLAQLASAVSSSAGLEASFQRRKQEWEFQKKLAEQELKQVQQQIAAASIRLAMAEKDLEIHEKQIEQAKEIYDFYKEKFTSLGLYNYLATTLGRLHRQAYSLALEIAQKAELAYRYERDEPDKVFIQNDNWNSARSGLLAGESLMLQLQQMELAYLEEDSRTLEVTQSFSMLQLAPTYLLNLRAGKELDETDIFTVPRWAFDLYYPKLYCRKIKSVRITIPCVVGPYVPVPATLTLLGGELIREVNGEPISGPPYALNTVVASTGNNDGGQFELNFRDERYLPFEGGGAINSKWKLELPAKYRAFDYETISDVVFHISYTAKQDSNKTGTPPPSDLPRLISLKQEFPDLLYELNQEGNCELNLSLGHFPYFAAQRGITVSSQVDDGSSPEGINISVNDAEDPSIVKICTLSKSVIDGPELDDVVFIVYYTINSD
jgi:hypothetical protein